MENFPKFIAIAWGSGIQEKRLLGPYRPENVESRKKSEPVFTAYTWHSAMVTVVRI